jgi:hypothetical protein
MIAGNALGVGGASVQLLFGHLELLVASRVVPGPPRCMPQASLKSKNSVGHPGGVDMATGIAFAKR